MPHIKHIIPLVFVILINLGCNAKKQETYWKISSIYREDKKPFIGLTSANMDEIVDFNFHFIKRNDSLFFDLPEKFTVDAKDLKNLKQLKIFGKDYYEMYESTFSGDRFQIKFKDNATSSPSKNTIIEFDRISKEEYESDIQKEIKEQKEIVAKINKLRDELQQKPQMVITPVKKLSLKTDTFINNRGEEIRLNIPQDIKIKKSGDIKTEKFDKIVIGTLKENSAVYDLKHPEQNYGLKQLTVYISTDSNAFMMDRYIADHPNFVLLKQEKDKLLGYHLSYDEETKQAIILSFFYLKYYKVDQSHVFLYADVYRSQMKGFPNEQEMNKIINFNYLIGENISVDR